MFKRPHNTVICSREATISGLGNVPGKTQYHGMFEGRHNTVISSREHTVLGLDMFKGRHNSVICSRQDTVLGLSNVQGKTQSHETVTFEVRQMIATEKWSEEDITLTGSRENTPP